MMQKNIQSYYRKVDELVRSRSKSSGKGKGKGLLATTKESMPTNTNEPKEMKLIADIVQGIREARQEMKDVV